MRLTIDDEDIYQEEFRAWVKDKLELVLTIKIIKKENSLLRCPQCDFNSIKCSFQTDVNDTYVVCKCTNCNYQVSPTHDSADKVTKFEEFNKMVDKLNSFKPEDCDCNEPWCMICHPEEVQK